MTAITVTMREMASQADADAFRALNEAWISKLFRLEPKDIATLSDPQSTILARGGHVYVALDGDTVVGAAALIRFPDGSFELSKMAVAEAMRGQGVGRALILYVIEQARTLGAHAVFLGSNSVLKNAVHLYESVGFRHVPPSELPEMKYERADVFMLLEF